MSVTFHQVIESGGGNDEEIIKFSGQMVGCYLFDVLKLLIKVRKGTKNNSTSSKKFNKYFIKLLNL